MDETGRFLEASIAELKNDVKMIANKIDAHCQRDFDSWRTHDQEHQKIWKNIATLNTKAAIYGTIAGFLVSGIMSLVIRIFGIK